MNHLPKARVLKRSAECLCGDRKSAGELTCRRCWNEAPDNVKRAMHRNVDRTLQSQAQTSLMEAASARNPAGRVFAL